MMPQRGMEITLLKSQGDFPLLISANRLGLRGAASRPFTQLVEYSTIGAWGGRCYHLKGDPI
jgi:hypothetical protein